MVKLSRRFLICQNWEAELQNLACNSQYATYGNACGFHNLPFRSECMGMRDETWHASGAVEEMRLLVRRGYRVAPMIERWYQSLALRIHKAHAPAIVKRREYFFPRDPAFSGYAIWNIMGLSRRSIIPEVFWHEVNSAADYYELALSWGINEFKASDFQLPNGDEAVRQEAMAMGLRNPNFEQNTGSK